MMMAMKLLFTMLAASAQGRSNLYTKPVPEKVLLNEKRAEAPRKKKHNTFIETGNLHSEILVNNSNFVADENATVLPTVAKGVKLRGLNIGDVLIAEIPESIIAFPEAKVPVRARVSYGKFKGAVLAGEATLEKNSKRILIDFKKIRTKSDEDEYQITASGLDALGILGVDGEYKSKESKYFLAEFLSGAAAGIAEASIERNQNVLGNYVEKPGGDTIAKKAAASAFSKTADVFAERIKNAPEYSVLEGPVVIQVLVTTQPIL